MTYRYETHLHTSPVSKCSRIGVRAALEFYKEQGYTGVFITNHFLSGQVTMQNFSSYEEMISFYFSDYEEAVSLSEKVGIDVMLGIEISLGGTHFLVYGLDKEWYLEHSEILQMSEKEHLGLLMDSGALIIQAHPFRQTKDTVFHRVFPNYCHGVEVYNGGNNDGENQMAKLYADHYSLPHFAGTDFHGKKKGRFCGVESDSPITDEKSIIDMFKNGELRCFEQIIE